MTTLLTLSLIASGSVVIGALVNLHGPIPAIMLTLTTVICWALS